MKKYFSTFAAGFEKPVERFLREDISPKDIRAMSGAIAYETAAPPSEIQKIKYFKNSYLVVGEYSGAKDLEEVAAIPPPKIPVPARARSFKLLVLERNKLVAVSGGSKAKLVSLLERRTGLKYGASSADVEFLLTFRDDGNVFLLERVTKSPIETERGELEPHVANILVRACRIAPGDIFIDPFAGSGAIPLARAAAGPYRGIFAMDIDAENAKKLKARVSKIRNSRMQKSFFVKARDFLENKFDGNFADVMATDPPWGEFQKIGADFYQRVFAEFARILKPGGCLILLVGREVRLPTEKDLIKNAEYDVLIHGKKAKVLTFAKV